jgi:hypothetical protein
MSTRTTDFLDRRSALAGLLVAGTGVLAGCGIPSDNAAPDPAPTHFSSADAPLPATGRKLLDAGPGQKWDVDGNAQRFTGNTFVSPIPQSSAFFRAEAEAQQLVSGSRFRNHYALRPHNSMHMTLYEGVNQSQIGTSDWPEWLAGKDMQAAHLAVLDAITQSGITAPRPITMRVEGLRLPMSQGISIHLTGADSATERALRDFRQRMQDVLQMSEKGFDTYTFHSTVGYRLVEQLPDEATEVEALGKKILDLFTGDAATVTLDPVAMNIYNDMLAYPQLRIL